MHNGFNGAATNWSRRCFCGRRNRLPVVALQWGRDQLVAEIGVAVYDESGEMRLQWGRDQLVAEIIQADSNRQTMKRFNGAATNWSRR